MTQKQKKQGSTHRHKQTLFSR